MLHMKMLPLTTAVTSCGLLSTWHFVWEGIDRSQKEPFAVCRSFLCPFHVLLALSWAVDTDGGFLRLTSEEFFWSAGRLACLPDDSSLYPLFLPSPLIFEWYQITSIKNKAKKKGFQKIMTLHNNGSFSSLGSSSLKETINERVGSGQLHTGFASPASVLCPSPKSPRCCAIAQSKTALTCSCWTPNVLSLNIVKPVMEKIRDTFTKRKKKAVIYI